MKQLTIDDITFEEPKREYVEIDEHGVKHIYHHTKAEFETLKRQYAAFWFDEVEQDVLVEIKCRVDGKTVYEKGAK